MTEKKLYRNNLRAHQIKATEFLQLFDLICKEHGIEYFLFAGSAIGAVRHSGFIPWDDDIDIGLRMPEYNELISLLPKENLNEFNWKHTDNDPDFPSLVIRVAVDDEHLVTIFPIVKLSDNTWKRNLQWMIRKIGSPLYQIKCGYELQYDSDFKTRSVNLLSRILSKLISKESLLRLIRWNEMKFENEDVANYASIYGKYSLKKETFKKEWVENLRTIEFEKGYYPIFKQYDEYLKYVYGEYMEYPDEEDRIPPHNSINK